MTARTEHGAFVAAARHFLADPWNRDLVLSANGKQGFSFTNDTIDVTYWLDKSIDVYRWTGPSEEAHELRLAPTSIRQAVACLVAAGILPAELRYEEPCPAKGLTRSDIPCNGIAFVAKHCTDRPTPDGDVHGCYRHVIMYASRINVVAGAVRVTAQAAQVTA